ncbi:MAG: hypothetical protein JW852_07835 [Spirochaetales bacterium]|nr:hypothetical protein [Spirochaetales bacterium]
MTKNRLWILIIVVFIVVLTVIVIFIARRSVPSQPAKESLTLSVPDLTDAKTLSTLNAVIDTYNSQSLKYAAAVTSAKNAEADLLFGPYWEGAVVWRSMGWRLWARLERLAAFEAAFGAPLILPLREGSVDAEAFRAMLDDLRDAGTVPLVMPRSPSAYSEAMELYLGRATADPAGGAAAADGWISDGRLSRVPDLRAAVNALEKNEAVFILADDSLRDFLRVTPQSHFEGFPLPGSTAPGASWVIGKGEGFVIPETAGNRAGALDLLTFLTSKGIAREFSQELPGYFYYWTETPVPGALPDVHGPAVFLDVKPR